MMSPESIWSSERLARRRKIGIAIVVIGLLILSVVFCHVAVYRERNRMLFLAVERNDPKRVQELMELGANINARNVYGATVFGQAVWHGAADVVKFILETHGDAISAQDKNDALGAASRMGHVEVARVLLDKGANVNARSNWGGNGLMVAAGSGHLRVVKLLLDKGADIHAKDDFGRTALMYACENGIPSLGAEHYPHLFPEHRG